VSEFSSSYHIRTADPREAERRLRRAKISGVVFGPANGWLTFVPYANLPALQRRADSGHFALDLSRVTDSAVLHYRYGEDHGWTFALARPRAPFNRFAS
jgi:hypothetical protein